MYRADTPGPKILVNYGVLTTGFDAPKTSGAIIARPTKSLVLYSQMVGRATRGKRAGGNAEAEVGTVVDRALPGFASLTEAFHNWEDVWRQRP
jgi:DNA repair protein RadD